MTNQTPYQQSDIPLEIKEKLLILAKKLPEAARSQFVRQTSAIKQHLFCKSPYPFIGTIAPS
jgi:hypothetical protein